MNHAAAAPSTIRRANADDVEALTRLRLALLESAGELGPDPAALAESIRGYLRASLSTARFLAWVAEADGQVVATSGLVLLEKPPPPATRRGSKPMS